MFVVYREGYEIYGIGETPEAAKTDAIQWLDDDMDVVVGAEMIEDGPGVFGKVYVSKCTDRLALALREDAQDLVFDWNENGLLDVIEGESVEE